MGNDFQLRMVWIRVIYYEKCNYHVLNNCILDIVLGESSFKITLRSFNFLIWDKNLES